MSQQPATEPAPSQGRSRSIGQRIREGERSISFEFFPPKDEAGDAQLWQALSELEPLGPTFVSVTYGAGGSSRETTLRVTGRIARETTMLPMGHLTCVGHTREELAAILDSYALAGVNNVLALRGDPEDGPRAAWTPTRGGLQYASQLVELAQGHGGFSIGVAAFPEVHPSSPSANHDADVLVAKARAGAEFAITQMFFDVEHYVDLVDRVRARGVDIPILPGIMPILNLRAIERQGELIGTTVPEATWAAFAGLTEPADIRAKGIALATQLCDDLLAAGAPGLHFYTLNRSRATREIVDALRIRA